jgi:hypothetical protein
VLGFVGEVVDDRQSEAQPGRVVARAHPDAVVADDDLGELLGRDSIDSVTVPGSSCVRKAWMRPRA